MRGSDQVFSAKSSESPTKEPLDTEGKTPSKKEPRSGHKKGVVRGQSERRPGLKKRGPKSQRKGSQNWDYSDDYDSKPVVNWY